MAAISCKKSNVAQRKRKHSFCIHIGAISKGQNTALFFVWWRVEGSVRSVLRPYPSAHKADFASLFTIHFLVFCHIWSAYWQLAKHSEPQRDHEAFISIHSISIHGNMAKIQMELCPKLETLYKNSDDSNMATFFWVSLRAASMGRVDSPRGY